MKQQNEMDELIVDLLETNHVPTEVESASLEQDAELQKSLSDGLTMKCAVVHKAAATDIDVDAEWTKFANTVGIETKQPEQQKKRIFSIRPYIVGIAASLALLVGVTVWYMFMRNEPYVAYTQQNNVTDCPVITSSSSRRSVVLDDDNINALSLSEESATDNILSALGCTESANEEFTVSMPAGRGCNITLSDGTTVNLHANSSLTYTKHFEGKERNVTLVGEAYFNVAKDAEHPFIVHTSHLDARVLGTEINVNSFTDGNASVALVRGSVLVQSKGNDILLNPGQIAKVNTSGIRVEPQDLDTYDYWQKGYIYFNDTPLSEVATAIGRWYNCGVVFDTPSLRSLNVRFFCLYDESLEHAASLISNYDGVEAYVAENVLHIK